MDTSIYQLNFIVQSESRATKIPANHSQQKQYLKLSLLKTFVESMYVKSCIIEFQTTELEL